MVHVLQCLSAEASVEGAWQVFQLSSHLGPVTSVAYAPNGKCIIR